MGSAARQDRCERFINEFSEDAVRVYGLNMAVAQGLEYDDVRETVIFTAIIMDGGEEIRVRLMNTPEFDLEFDIDIVAEELASAFKLTLDEVTERMEKAGLD